MAPVTASVAAPEVVSIFYGSQTGTGEEVAWDLARQGRRRGHACGDPQALNELDARDLARLHLAVFVVATTGQGDPPVNMRRLWQQLLAASLPKTFLCGLRFAVFGLGDSHYREFNYASRKLHARLQGLGGEPFVRLGLGDDQHDFGFEQELDPWAESMWAALAELCPPQADVGPVAEPDAALEQRYEVEMLGEAPPSQVASGSGASCRLPQHPEEFQARVVSNRSLCTEGHSSEQQDVRNVRLEVPQGTSYKAGDVCVVWPRADAELVRLFVVETLGLSLHMRVQIHPARRSWHADGGGATSIFPETPLTLEEVFTSYVDISAVPSRHFFHVLSLHTEHELHGKKLREFASRTLEAKDALYEYCKRERRSAAEVMWDFWTARPPLPQLLSALPPLRPRRYSIASSPAWLAAGLGTQAAARLWLRYRAACGPAWSWRSSTGAVELACAEALQRAQREESAGCSLDLCVAVVRFTTRTGRKGLGLCSSFLQAAAVGSTVLCSFEKGSLALPPLEVPLILICPGTGLSPCRALLQERHLEVSRRGAATTGRFAAGLMDLLFLGFRHRDGDFLYGDEWPTFDSWLRVHVAFSRDHEDRKVYVQDMIEEQGAHVCRLLDAGACIFVCGRSHPMPSQVFDSLAEVLHLHRGLSMSEAGKRLREMQRSQRYICDTWG